MSSRAFRMEEQEQKHFRQENEHLTDLQKFVGRISGLMNPVTYIIVNGAVIVLLYTGAVRVDAGILTQGQVVALVNYMEPDSGRTGKTGKPDYHRNQSSSLWKPDPEYLRNSVQYEERNQRDKKHHYLPAV